MPNNPPPDLILFVAAKLGDPPVEIAHAIYAMFDETSVSVRLGERAPQGYAAELAEKLRAAFPDKTIAVL